MRLVTPLEDDTFDVDEPMMGACTSSEEEMEEEENPEVVPANVVPEEAVWPKDVIAEL